MFGCKFTLALIRAVAQLWIVRHQRIMSETLDYLIGTCFDIGARSFSVLVAHDGFGYWTDEAAGVTVRVAVPESVLREIRDELSARYWADCENDFDLNRRLHEMFMPLFWEHVSQHFRFEPGEADA